MQNEDSRAVRRLSRGHAEVNEFALTLALQHAGALPQTGARDPRIMQGAIRFTF
jgi:hypothetical protein